jgi:hypothetical protein
MRNQAAAFLVVLCLGCVQQLDLNVTLGDVPVPAYCSLSNTTTLTDFEYAGTFPVQQSYVCDSKTKTDDIFDFYNSNMTGWHESKSVKTEYLVALVFDKTVEGNTKEVFGVTYTIFQDQALLILVKGYSDRVLDTGWV